MASDKRAELLPLASSASVLHQDALHEVLLRLPPKDVCRLRAVCPSWRSLTYDPLFVKAHAARHKGPLLATTFVNGESCGVSIVDVSSGSVIKRIRTSTSDRGLRVQRTNLDHVCLVGGRHPLAVPVTVLNPATGAVISSSHHISDKYRYLLRERNVSMDSCAFGKVPSTGVYKALRFLQVRPPISRNQLCEVMTLDDGSGHAQWRAIAGPPGPVFSDNKMKSVVIDGVVYFLFDFSHRHRKYLEVPIKPASIAAFNLETEEWMANIDGPEPVMKFYGDHGMLPLFEDPETVELLSITNLNGSLVTVQAVHGHFMELWFLTDLEKGLWVKKYSIRQYRREDLFSFPLLVLDDERIIFIMQLTGLLQVYDPKTESYTDMWQLEDYKFVGIYTGNLLS